MTNRHILILAAACLVVPITRGQTIERVSVSTAGAQGDGPVDRVTRAGADGRFVVFSSLASNFLPADVPGTRDVFLRDRLTGTTARIAGDAAPVDLSDDGARLSFTQVGGLLGSAVPFAHVLEIATGTDQQLTTTVPSEAGPFSGDGRFVVYTRSPAPAVEAPRVLRRELGSGTETLVSATPGGTPGTGTIARAGAVSFDGSIVTFTSDAPDLVAGDGNGSTDAFFRAVDFFFGDRYSVTDTNGEIPGASTAGVFTPDTRFLLFASGVDGVVQGDANGRIDLFTFDLFFSATTIVSLTHDGQFADGDSFVAGAWISPDGERIVFASAATNLVPGDTNGSIDVFERNVATGTTRRLVHGLGGAAPDADVVLRGVSADGRFLSITSAATNLVAGDTNGMVDAFLVDLGPQCAVSSFCTALPNSTGRAALLGSTGMPSLALNNFVLSCVDLPDSTTCVFFHGPARQDPPLPFGNGLRCVAGTLVRLGTLQAGSGAVIQHQDLAASAYAGVQPGDVRRFQLVYRDLAAQGAGFNTSDGLEVAFCP